MLASFFCAVRLAIITLLGTVVLYAGLLVAVGQLLFPWQAGGELLVRDGVVVGSRLLAQEFTADRYLWPRPSAVQFAADASGGSNLAPGDPALALRAVAWLGRLGATPDRPAPADLVQASGSGLDPHVSLEAARFQAPRVARARGTTEAAVADVIGRVARDDGTRHHGLVNVLLVNLALDDELPAPGS